MNTPPSDANISCVGLSCSKGPDPTSSRSSGNGLDDAAARRAGGRGAPERLEARGQLAAVGRREPEAQQKAIAVRAVRILVPCAPMVDHVVVEKLEIAGLELHGEGQFLTHFGVQVEGLLLSRG